METFQLKQITDLAQYKTAHLDAANRMVVATPQDEELAATVLVEIARVRKDLESRRKVLVDPINRHVRFINGEAKKISEPLEEADRIVRDKVRVYREGLRKEEEASRAVVAQLGADEWMPDATRQAPVRVDGGKVGSRMDWTFEVTDLSIVPREYLMLDERKVRGVIKGGIRREIAGLRVFQKIVLSVMT